MTDAAEPGSASEPVYGFTFGVYDQTAPWTDVRELTWDALVSLLTTHAVGPKPGTCIVPARFDGGKRTKHKATQIDVVFLDSDSGATLDEIRAAIAKHGWRAIISSTHSHGVTRTTIKRGGWDKYLLTADPAEAAGAYLDEEKGFDPRVAWGARVAADTPDEVTFEHQPCPKFRIAIPLARPWLASSYESQADANAAWKERIEALAAALRLSHDQSCTDTSRLFYLPRRPADGPPLKLPYSMVSPATFSRCRGRRSRSAQRVVRRRLPKNAPSGANATPIASRSSIQTQGSHCTSAAGRKSTLVASNWSARSEAVDQMSSPGATRTANITSGA